MLPFVTQEARYAAARPASSDEIPKIAKKLSDLRKGYGVWRDGLAGFLGPELCNRLHVVTRSQPNGAEPDGADEVRAKIIWHLRRLVGGKNDEENRRSAAISFNITPYPELRTMDSVKERVQWGSERGLCKARKAVDTRTGRIIPDLARELGKIQPIPPRMDIAAILGEFRGDNYPSEAPASTRVIEVQQPWRRSLGRLVRARVSRTMAGVVSGTVASVLAAGVVAGATGIFDSTDTASQQDALRVTLNQVRSTNGLWHAVFPVGAQNIERFATQEEYPPDPDAFLAEELDAGAYLSGGAAILVEVENYGDREITLFDIRVANRRLEPPALGAAIFVSPIGGRDTPRIIRFDLDASPPLARDSGGTEFFSAQRIGLRPSAKESLLLILTSDRAAYSFDIELQYELGGKEHTMVLRRNGQPFRVTVDLCNELFGDPLPNPELDGLRYASVRWSYQLDTTGTRHGIKSVGPSDACEPPLPATSE